MTQTKSVIIKRWLLAFFVGMTTIFHLATCRQEGPSEVATVQEMTVTPLRGDEFGITGGNNEIALTFDDGPGDCSLEMAKFLVSEEVPATFFVTLSGDPTLKAYAAPILKEIGELKLSNGQYAFNIGNHTFSHLMTPRGHAAVTDGERAEDIARLDEFITPFNNSGQFFFRAPGGAFTTDPYQVAIINNTKGLSKYIGPVSWNIGGELEYRDDGKTIKYSADWSCWRKLGLNWNAIESCMLGYLNEMNDKRARRFGGIVLMHDDGNKRSRSGNTPTWEMVMGPIDYATCQPLNPEMGIIRRAKAAGFKFVALQEHTSKKNAGVGF